MDVVCTGSGQIILGKHWFVITKCPEEGAALGACLVLLLIYLSSLACSANVNWFTLEGDMNKFFLHL